MWLIRKKPREDRGSTRGGKVDLQSRTRESFKVNTFVQFQNLKDSESVDGYKRNKNK